MVKSNLLSRLLVLVCLSGAACLQVVPNGHRIASSHGVFRSQPSAMLTGRLREKTRRWRGAEEASVEAAAPAATPPVVPSPLPPRPPPPPPVAPPPVAPPPVATPPVAPLAAARSAATKVTKDSTTTPSSNIDLAPSMRYLSTAVKPCSTLEKQNDGWDDVRVHSKSRRSPGLSSRRPWTRSTRRRSGPCRVQRWVKVRCTVTQLDTVNSNDDASRRGYLLHIKPRLIRHSRSPVSGTERRSAGRHTEEKSERASIRALSDHCFLCAVGPCDEGV